MNVWILYGHEENNIYKSSITQWNGENGWQTIGTQLGDKDWRKQDWERNRSWWIEEETKMKEKKKTDKPMKKITFEKKNIGNILKLGGKGSGYMRQDIYCHQYVLNRWEPLNPSLPVVPVVSVWVYMSMRMCVYGYGLYRSWFIGWKTNLLFSPGQSGNTRINPLFNGRKKKIERKNEPTNYWILK